MVFSVIPRQKKDKEERDRGGERQEMRKSEEKGGEGNVRRVVAGVGGRGGEERERRKDGKMDIEDGASD